MKRIALLLALVPTLALADKSFVGKSGTHDCSKDPNISINTGDGTYIFMGTCQRVSISGGGNTVTIESVESLVVSGGTNKVDVGAADKIDVVGSNNTVTYKKGIAGPKPKVASVGGGNKITQVK